MVVDKDGALQGAARGHVIQGVRIFEAGRSRHGTTLVQPAEFLPRVVPHFRGLVRGTRNFRGSASGIASCRR